MIVDHQGQRRPAPGPRLLQRPLAALSTYMPSLGLLRNSATINPARIAMWSRWRAVAFVDKFTQCVITMKSGQEWTYIYMPQQINK